MITTDDVTLPIIPTGPIWRDKGYYLKYDGSTGALDLLGLYHVKSDGTVLEYDSRGAPAPGKEVGAASIGRWLESAESKQEVIDPSEAVALYVAGVITPRDLLTTSYGVEQLPDSPAAGWGKQPWIDVLTASRGRLRIIRRSSQVGPYSMDTDHLLACMPSAETSDEPLIDRLTCKAVGALVSDWEAIEELQGGRLRCSCGFQCWSTMFEQPRINLLVPHKVARHRRGALPPEEVEFLLSSDWPEVSDKAARRFLTAQSDGAD